ncbi:NUDIX domain-containing protein [Sphingomonas sp. UNC305MFCol5.2]|uniref:NUDIX domain-containing protein n=1 Tax=Sphingomonas sp. UNC305MFCol5.2 TaxID=1449076 RepID=UPI0004A74893|nr:NUDIX domain-containing protein [Sphingomonas sp. UNC305MFCol5.2]
MVKPKSSRPPASAGILLYRRLSSATEVLLVHPGGPFWRNKNIGGWQIPKGMIKSGEDMLTAARRETEEELGIRLNGTPAPLGEIRQAGGKVVHVFALEQELDVSRITSNRFRLEWPPRGGRLVSFPEIDRACWLTIAEARLVMLASQQPLLDRLEAQLCR